MKIVSWNVNGIRATIRKGFVKTIKKINPDIICMQEIKADEIPKEIEEMDYEVAWNPAKKKGYAGTAILSRDKSIEVKNKIGTQKFDDEGRFLLCKFKDFQLFNTYFPHSRRDLGRFEFKQEFNEKYFDFINKLKGFTILTGDYNVAHEAIDLANPMQNEKNAGFTKEERQFMDKLTDKWVDTFRKMHPKTVKYSWWTYRFNARKRNVGWRIDYFLVKQKDIKKIKGSDVLTDVQGSDHAPILLTLKK